MRKTLIIYKPEFIDLAIKLRDNYLAHNVEVDIISEKEQGDIEYARKPRDRGAKWKNQL